MRPAILLGVCFLMALSGLQTQAAEPGQVTGLPLDKARVCITGHNPNRPDPFPRLGDFIGCVGGVT